MGNALVRRIDVQKYIFLSRLIFSEFRFIEMGKHFINFKVDDDSDDDEDKCEAFINDSILCVFS